MPSAVLLSIGIHAALFLLAGWLVVFSVVRQKEVEFIPPKAVERPKMKLKKPKVRIKKTAKPKPTTRIVTKVKKASMPDIQIPEMSGMGESLGGGLGGFELVPDLGEVTIFGGGQTIGNDFVGTFYDFKRDRKGNFISTDTGEFTDKLLRFIKNGWRPSDLARYYRSPKKLYATCFMIPPILSSLGPRAFGEDTGGWTWMVLYKGKLVYPEDIKFRFWGFGDDILVVRVNNKVVLNGSWHNDGVPSRITLRWDSDSCDDSRFWYANNKARVGDLIELKAGVPVDMEVMIGEVPGGIFSSMLTVQVEGVEYPKNRQGGSILPMFKTAEPSRDLQDIIYASLIQNEASVTNGPVFRDYMVPPQTNQPVEAVASTPAETKKEKSKPKEPKIRVWNTVDGKRFEAECVAVMAGKAVLKSSRGKMLKIPLDRLSADDREYVELADPPKFAIDFVKLSDNQLNRYEPSPFNPTLPPRVNDFTFGARLKKRSAGEYNHELTVEYFAIGKELLGNKYVLLDRQSSTFIPTKENGYSHYFTGKPVEMIEYVNFDDQSRGVRPDGNMVIVTDKRGRIIQHSSSKAWLWDNVDNLKKLPVGAYMDKTCTRAYPSSPKPTLW